VGSDYDVVAVNPVVTDLTENTGYHARLVVTSAAGTVYSGDVMFNTPGSFRTSVDKTYNAWWGNTVPAPDEPVVFTKRIKLYSDLATSWSAVEFPTGEQPDGIVSFSPMSGTVGPGNNPIITITIDASTLLNNYQLFQMDSIAGITFTSSEGEVATLSISVDYERFHPCGYEGENTLIDCW
jgi:hypothetical protein